MRDALTDKKQVLFIRGGGEGAYEADAKLAASLGAALGEGYVVRYPQMPGDEAPTSAWLREIGAELEAMKGAVILAGHSFGGAVLLQYLAEAERRHCIAGIFIIAAPFWDGDKGWQFEGFRLQADFAERLPAGLPIYLYHNSDDAEVPFAHLGLFAARLPWAVVRETGSGGHQFGDDLTQVARDIKALA